MVKAVEKEQEHIFQECKALSPFTNVINSWTQWWRQK